MPSISDSLDFQRTPPNAFVSPFSDRSPAVFYSSITVPGSAASKGRCLTCALQDLSSETIEDILEQFAQPIPSTFVREGLRAYPTTEVT